MSFKTTVNLLTDGACKPVNCRICGDELVPALCPVSLGGEGISGVIFADRSEAQNEFYLCDGEGLYASLSEREFWRICNFEGSYPFMIEDIADGEARSVIVSGERAVVNKGERFSMIYSLGAALRCGVMHCGRLFGIDLADGYKLRWSGAGGITDWKEDIAGSGSLTLDPERGEALDILEYGEKLVVVRKFGLTVLNMFGSPENFSVDITDTDTDEIFRGTARAVCGKLIFCTASGLHSFDGSNIAEISHRFSGDIYGAKCSAEFGGKYFLSCNSKSLQRGAVLCYDPSDGESYLIDIEADGLYSSGNMYAYNRSGAHRLQEGGEWRVTTGEISFGSGRDKTVTRTFIGGKGLDVEISNGRTTRKFAGVKGLIRPKMRGKSFVFRVAGKSAVGAVTATAEECDAI